MQPLRVYSGQASAADIAALVAREPAIAAELAKLNLILAPLVDRAWEMVRRWPGLRGEDKLAWYCVWRRSQWGHQRVSVTPADIAADQGTTADAGRPRFKKLQAAGLWVIARYERSTGVYTIEPQQPGDVAQALGVQFDPQQFFDFAAESVAGNHTFGPVGQEPSGGPSGAFPPGVLPVSDRAAFHPAEDPPELPPEDPRFPNLDTSSLLRIPTSHLEHLDTLSGDGVALGKGANRGSSGGTSPASRATSADRDAADLLAQIAQKQASMAREERPSTGGGSLGRDATIALVRAEHLASPEWRERQVAEIVQTIRRRVNRPGDEIYRGPCCRIAWAIAEGHVKQTKLDEALRQLDNAATNGTLQTNRSRYMNGCIKRLLIEAGLPTEDPPAKPR